MCELARVRRTLSPAMIASCGPAVPPDVWSVAGHPERDPIPLDVIPNARAFTSGRRDLACSWDAPREIPFIPTLWSVAQGRLFAPPEKRLRSG
jgi:hypothetical protein